MAEQTSMHIQIKTAVIILLLISFSAFGLYGQNAKKNVLGTHFAFGTSTYKTKYVYDGTGKMRDGIYDYTIGLDYARILSKRWSLYSGFDYLFNNISEEKLASIPVQLKYSFEKLLFIKGGPLLSMYLPYNNLLFGCELGAGLQHEFASGINLSLSPFGKAYASFQELFLQAGIRLGIEYKF